MFIIATSGRCGTHAICHGLDRYSDHRVEHEPPPRLLEEAALKHRGGPFASPALAARMRDFRDKAGTPYGQSFRAPNLLGELSEAAPRARFLVIVRHPLDYVRSAHSKRVFRKGDVWDRTRIMPRGPGGGVEYLPLAHKIAWHWSEVNRYLLDFVEGSAAPARVVLLGDLAADLPRWTEHLGVAVTDPAGLAAYLGTRPNAAEGGGVPDGYDEGALARIVAGQWGRALALLSNSEKTLPYSVVAGNTRSF